MRMVFVFLISARVSVLPFQCRTLCIFRTIMSVKSNFTFDLIFLMHEDSERIGFHFLFLQNLKWQPNENDR